MSPLSRALIAALLLLPGGLLAAPVLYWLRQRRAPRALETPAATTPERLSVDAGSA